VRNVLFVICDEMARSALGCYGNAAAITPHLDALARTGVRFSRAITPSPICIPARASLATGLAVHEHGCWSSAQAFEGAHQTWMGAARDRGCDVVSIGKLHFKRRGLDYGFSEERHPMYVANGGVGWAEALLRTPLPAYDGAPEMARDVGPGDTSYTDYDRTLADDAEGWLRARSATDKPFVLSVSLVSPHYPLSAPQHWYDRYAGVEMPPRLAVEESHPVLREMARFWDYDRYFSDDQRREARRNYYALCSMVDDTVGRLVAALDDSGLRDNTATSLLSLAKSPDLSRCVLSEYHDGGSPCGFALLQRRGHKLVRYADGYPDQFFDTETDPDELRDLATLDVPEHAELSTALNRIVDIDACNRLALDSQAALLASLGGEAGLAALTPFNHTPVGS